MSRTRMPFTHMLAWSILGVIMIAITAGAVYQQIAASNPPAAAMRASAASPEKFGTLPEFSLMTEKGNAITREGMQGKIWVADFIFSYCGGQCPLMTSRMRELQTWLDEQKMDEVRLVSFTVDPDNDTTAVLSEYAQRFKTDPAKWDFVTGDRQAIYALARQGFKLGVDDQPEEGAAPEEEPIIHSNRFVLVDANANIRGYYSAEDAEALAKLRKDIGALKRSQKP